MEGACEIGGWDTPGIASSPQRICRVYGAFSESVSSTGTGSFPSLQGAYPC